MCKLEAIEEFLRVCLTTDSVDDYFMSCEEGAKESDFMQVEQCKDAILLYKLNSVGSKSDSDNW